MKIDDVIAAACEELDTSYENNALWFEVLIHQAIRSHKTMRKLVDISKVLELYDNKTTLPIGWSKIKSILLCGTTMNYCPDIDYSIQGDTLIFNSALGMKDGTRIEVRYFGLRMDENENILIPDDWERMLVAYIGWKYTRRYIKQFGVAVMQNFQREYQNQKLANI